MIQESPTNNAGNEGCVELRYWGHSCFELALESGHSVVFDPHDGTSIGLPEPRVEADLVLISHDHHDHNAYETVAKSNALVLKEMTGAREIQLGSTNIRVEGRKAPHDREGGRRRGLVTLYKVVFPSGLVFVHLGDLGVVPGEEVLSWIGEPRPTVLMVPVGGFFTIEPYEAWEIVEKTRPIYAAPMHYWVRGAMLPVLKVWDFILTARTGRVEADESFKICPGEEFSEKTRILVFKKWLY